MTPCPYGAPTVVASAPECRTGHRRTPGTGSANVPDQPRRRSPDREEQPLVGLADRGGRHPSLDEPSARCAHLRPAGPGRRAGRRARRRTRRGPRAAPTHPHRPARSSWRPRSRHRRWPAPDGPRRGSSTASTARSIGPARCAAAPGAGPPRRAPRAGAPAAASARTAGSSSPSAACSEPVERRATAVDDEHHVVAVAVPSRGVDHQVERLRQPDVAGVHDDGATSSVRTRPGSRSRDRPARCAPCRRSSG